MSEPALFILLGLVFFFAWLLWVRYSNRDPLKPAYKRYHRLRSHLDNPGTFVEEARKVMETCIKVIRQEPRNGDAMALLAGTYMAVGARFGGSGFEDTAYCYGMAVIQHVSDVYPLMVLYPIPFKMTIEMYQEFWRDYCAEPSNRDTTLFHTLTQIDTSWSCAEDWYEKAIERSGPVVATSRLRYLDWPLQD